MGACCPKPKRSASDAGSDDNAPLMSAQNGIPGNKGRPISCTPSEPESKDTDERAVYNQIIDETQGQVNDVYWSFTVLRKPRSAQVGAPPKDPKILRGGNNENIRESVQKFQEVPSDE